MSLSYVPLKFINLFQFCILIIIRFKLIHSSLFPIYINKIYFIYNQKCRILIFNSSLKNRKKSLWLQRVKHFISLFELLKFLSCDNGNILSSKNFEVSLIQQILKIWELRNMFKNVSNVFYIFRSLQKSA